jgi:hypothetical protein
MKLITSSYSFILVPGALLWLCILPSFTVSQNQNNQTITITNITSTTSDLVSVNNASEVQSSVDVVDSNLVLDSLLNSITSNISDSFIFTSSNDDPNNNNFTISNDDDAEDEDNNVEDEEEISNNNVTSANTDPTSTTDSSIPVIVAITTPTLSPTIRPIVFDTLIPTTTLNIIDVDGDGDVNVDVEIIEDENENENNSIETVDTVENAETIIPVTGMVNLELINTPSLMGLEKKILFLDTTKAFLSVQLFFGLFMSPIMMVETTEGITIELIRQSRSSSSLLFDDRTLQQQQQQQQQQNSMAPLYVTLKITGIAAIATQQDNDDFSYDANMEFENALQQIFIGKEVEYVEALQITGDIYFSSLDEVNVILQEEEVPDNNSDSVVENENTSNQIIETNEDNTNNNDNINTEEDPAIINPGIFPPDFDAVQDGGMTTIDQQDDSQNDGLSLGSIIGIAVGASVLFFLAVFLLCYFYFINGRQRKDDNNSNIRTGSSEIIQNRSISSSSKKKKKSWNRHSSSKRNSSNIGPVDSMAEQDLLRSQTSSIKGTHDDAESTDLASNDDVESQAMYSYNQSRGDSGSVFTTGNNSNFKIQTNYTNNDNMSYAYSLEPGIEASVIDGVTVMNDASTLSKNNMNGEHDFPPIREIPNISVRGARTTDNNFISNGDGDTQIETAPSELKLTESELEMLPSNLRSYDDEDEDDNYNEKGTIRKVQAPDGKLGIVIDTTVDGPVVYSVNKKSRLSGKIFPGDIITAINDTDTRTMSASHITAVMIKTANQPRTLTVRGVH